MNRRTFLVLSIMCGVRRRLHAASSDWAQKAPNAYGAILGETTFAANNGDRQKLARTWQALSEIYRRTQSPPTDPAAAQQTAEEVRKIINEGRRFDPQTFNLLAGAMQGIDPDVAEQRDAFAHGFGVALQRLGPFVGLINPAMGLATNVAGQWAEDTLKYLAQPGLNLSVSLLPPTDGPSLGVINDLVYAKFAENFNSNPTFRDLVSNPDVRAQLGVNLASDPAALVRQLPEVIRNTVSPLLNNAIDDLRNDDSVLKGVLAAVSPRFDAIDQHLADLNAALSEQRDAMQRQLDIQNAKARLEYEHGELSGAITFGTVLIGNIFGNEKLASEFNAVFSAGQRVYETAAQLALGVVGPFALLGTVAGALGSIFGLFQSGPSLYDLIKQDLDRLSTKIDDLAKHLDTRLMQIEVRELQILNRLNELYDLVLRGNQQAAIDFGALQASLQNTQSLISQSDREREMAAYTTTVLSCRRFFATQPAPDFTQASVQKEFRDYLTAFYKHAITTARLSAFCGDHSIELGPDVFVRFAAEVQGRKHLELMFGLTTLVAQMFSIPLDLPPAIPDQPDSAFLPNPVEWSRAVQAYLETRILTTAVESAVTEQDLKNMWAEGLRIRGAFTKLGGWQMLDAANRVLMSQTEFWHYLYSLFDEWARDNLEQFGYTRVSPDQTSLPIYKNKRLYHDLWSPGTLGQYFLLFDSADPFDIAEKKGWFTRGTIDSFAHTAGYDLTTTPLSVPGYWDNGHGRQTVTETTFRDNSRIEVLVDEYLLDFFIALYRKNVEYPAKKQNFKAWLASRIKQPSPEISQYEAVAGAARMCLTASYMCQASFHDDHLSDLNNASIMSTREELIDALNAWIDDEHFTDTVFQKLTFDETRRAACISMSSNTPSPAKRAEDATVLLRRVSSNLRQTPEHLKGPFVLDETMRRLGGYMKVRGIDPQIPMGPPGVPSSAQTTDRIRQLADAARNNFKDATDVLLHDTGSRKVFASKIELPGWFYCAISVNSGDSRDAFADAEIDYFAERRDSDGKMGWMLTILRSASFRDWNTVLYPGDTGILAELTQPQSGVKVQLVRAKNVEPDNPSGEYFNLHLLVLSANAHDANPTDPFIDLLGPLHSAAVRRVALTRFPARAVLREGRSGEVASRIAFRQTVAGKDRGQTSTSMAIERLKRPAAKPASLPARKK